MNVRNLKHLLKDMNDDDEIAVALWSRDDAEQLVELALDDDQWSYICDNFGNQGSEEIGVLLFSYDFHEDVKTEWL
jgi:hypothetical protein